MPSQTVVPPGGQFQLPASSSEPLVAFRCAPVFRPYLEEDGKDAAFIIDTPIMYKYIQGAAPISLPTSLSHSSQDLVTISIGNHLHTTIGVPVNATGFEFSLDIRSLLAQKTAYNVSCSATYKIETSSSKTITQYFSTNTSLLYLPDTSSSVVKTDLRTGALWTQPAVGTVALLHHSFLKASTFHLTNVSQKTCRSLTSSKLMDLTLFAHFLRTTTPPFSNKFQIKPLNLDYTSFMTCKRTIRT